MRISVSGLIQAGAFALAAMPSLTSAAWIHFDPSDTSKVPKKFSQTGFYTNIAAKNKVATSEAVPFEVNAPLWSDNAAKNRWIILNSAAQKVNFDPAEDYWVYPEGTVFVKLFQHDTVAGDPSKRIYWETRLLVKKQVPDTVSWEPLEVHMRDHWYPFSYKWNAAATDADLVPIKKGLDTTLYVWINGVKTFRKWTFPSEKTCNDCHRQFVAGTQGRTVLGFFTAQLNRKDTPRPGANQIRELFARNVLSWSRPAPPTEAELDSDTMPRWARLTDSAASLDLRARSYIGANCSGCHGTRGLATIATDHSHVSFDFFRMTPGMELRHLPTRNWDLPPVVTPKGDSLLPEVIVPGYPQISVLLHRLSTRNRANPAIAGEKDTAFFNTEPQMPKVGVFEVDTVAAKLVREWILAMPEIPNIAIHKELAGRGAVAPRIQGGILTLPLGLRGNVILTGLDGRSQPLVRLSEATLRLPQDMRPGVYVLRVGARSFKLLR